MTSALAQFRCWLLIAGLAIALVPRVAKADDVSPDAKTHFKAGVSYLEDPEGQRFEDAYAEFKKAYELSHSPKVLGNLGLCAMKLERDGEAIDAYTRYLAEVPDIDPGERAQIARDLQTLVASVVTATVTSDTPSGMIVDTRVPVRGPSVSNAYELAGGSARLRVRPGHHLMHLRSQGRDVADWEFTAEASELPAHRFEASSAPAPIAPLEGSRRDLVGPILVMSLGAAALITGGVLGASTLEKVHTVEGECPSDACPAGVYSHDLATARTFVTATDVTLLAGGVVTAGGAVWLLLSRPRAEPASVATAGGGCTRDGCYGSITVGF